MNTSKKVFRVIDIIISAGFLYYSVHNNAPYFLFGFVLSLPVNWIIFYFIFYSNGPTLGMQLSRLSKYIFPATRIILILIVIFGNFIYRNYDFKDAIYDGGNQSFSVLLSLGYHGLQSIVTQIVIYLLVISIISLFVTEDIYNENYDIKHKQILSGLALWLPFILLGIVIIAVLISQWLGYL